MSFDDDFVLPPRPAGRSSSRRDVSRSPSVSSSVDDRSSGRHERPSQPPTMSQFLRQRVLSITDYADELRSGGVERLSERERIARFGSKMVPIPVPLEPKEREATHQKRFRGWLTSHRIDLSRESVVSERKLRTEFAIMKTRKYDGGRLLQETSRNGKRPRASTDEERQRAPRDEDADDDVGDGEDAPRLKRPRVDAPSILLRRRVVPMAQYREELEEKLTPAQRQDRYGTVTAPVPVPLFPGETTDDYERRFWKYVASTKVNSARFKNDPNNERSVRINFARSRAKHAPPGPQPVVQVKPSIFERLGEPSGSEPSGSEPSGSDSNDEVATEHIERQVEATHRDNTSHDVDASALLSPAACSFTAPSPGTSTATRLRALLACGCHACLVECTHRLVDQLEEQERAATASSDTRTVTAATAPVMDITRDGDTSHGSASTKGVDMAKMVQLTSLMKSRRMRQSTSSSSTTRSSRPVETLPRDDPIEQQLVAQYDEINARVAEHQHALTNAAAQLQATPIDNMEETTALQRDMQDLEGLVEDEMDNRNAALAMLAVYLWRHDRPELTQRINSSGASDVAHVQRVCHHKCATLAVDVADKRAQVASLKQQLDAVLLGTDEVATEDDRLTTLQRIGEQLTRAEQAMAALYAARRREVATLLL